MKNLLNTISALLVLVKRISDYINQNETRRISVGLALSGGSILYAIFLSGITATGTTSAFVITLLTGFLFALGMTILVCSIDLASVSLRELRKTLRARQKSSTASLRMCSALLAH